MSHTATCDRLGDHDHPAPSLQTSPPPAPRWRDDTAERCAANRAVAVSAAGLAATGLLEILIAVATGSDR